MKLVLSLFCLLIVFLLSDANSFIGARLGKRKEALDCYSGSPTIGTVCPGGAIYAGTFTGDEYMVTPSGCGYEPSGTTTSYSVNHFTPTCSGGTDTINKTWNDGNATVYDIPGAESFTPNTQQSSSSYKGNINTQAIIEITNSAQGGYHAAARYCDRLEFGGYTDWYLPSKSELAYIYCKSRTSGGASYPEEDANCASYGYGVGSNILSGFATVRYWASTEANGTYAWNVNFSTGAQAYTTLNKYSTTGRVRCTRRLGPDLVTSFPTASSFAADVTVTGLDVDYNSNPEGPIKTLTVKNRGDFDATNVTATSSGGFDVVGGSCSPGTPLTKGSTCTIDLRGTSDDRWENGSHSGTLTLSFNGRKVIIALSGTSINLPDGCYRASAPIGTVCANGAVYAGVYSGETYMTTPGGCGYEPSGNGTSSPTSEFTPTCSGTDTTVKTWNDGISNSYDIPDVETISANATPSTYRGNVNSTAIVQITDTSQGGYHAAARYCDKMSFGGYTDWFLPSKSELSYMFCKSVTSGSGSYPADDLDCASVGYASGTHLLTGFAQTSTSYYWCSTETTAANAFRLRFDIGYPGAGAKNNTATLFRCMRRVGPNFVGSLPVPGTFDPSLSVSGLDVDYTANPESTSQTLTIKNLGDADATGVTMSISSEFAIVGGTCSPAVALAVGATCSIEIKGTSTDRWYNETVNGSLILSNNQRTTIIPLSGTSVNFPDPCSRANPPTGVICTGGAHFAGSFDSGKYMVTPGGCGYEPSGTTTSYTTADFTPTCSGNDTMTKAWRGTANNYDIPGVQNVTAVGTASSSSYRGDVNTAAIVAITLTAEGSYHPAGRYCDKLDYGGYQDWYLPSKSEMAFVFCRSRSSGTNASYPQENPDCSSYGYGVGTRIVPGFATGASYYWSSTEASSSAADTIRADNGIQTVTGLKGAAYLVRCVRRY